MAQLEADEDLCLTLSPFDSWRGFKMFPVLHFDILEHAFVELKTFIDHSRNSMTVVERGIIQLMEAFEGQRDEF